jgi:hypothetical protein
MEYETLFSMPGKKAKQTKKARKKTIAQASIPVPACGNTAAYA